LVHGDYDGHNYDGCNFDGMILTDYQYDGEYFRRIFQVMLGWECLGKFFFSKSLSQKIKIVQESCYRMNKKNTFSEN
jgi:hypothetical protein